MYHVCYLTGEYPLRADVPDKDSEYLSKMYKLGE